MIEQIKKYDKVLIILLINVLLYYDIIQTAIIYILYPLYLLAKTIKLLEHNRTKVAEFRYMLKAYASFSCFLLLDYVCSYFAKMFGMYFVYSIAKLLLFLLVIKLCDLGYMYDGFVRPYYLSNKKNVDIFVNKIEDMSKSFIINMNLVKRYLESIINRVIVYSSSNFSAAKPLKDAE